MRFSHSLGLALVSGLLLSACELTQSELDAMHGALSADSSDYGGGTPPVAPSCFNERFVQPEAIVTKSIDLLFVADTSASLYDERGRVADGIDAFVRALPPDVDYRIAVMLAHSSKSQYAGKLWKYGGRGPVLNSKTKTLDQIRADLRYLLLNTADDWYGDGGEEGFFSLLRGLNETNLAQSRALGFFRPEAALAVVFISDENEMCAKYPEGVTRAQDLEGLEAPASARDCAGITPEAVHATVKNLQGVRPYAFGAIVYNNHDTYPRKGENEYGYGFMELIQLTSGVSIDLAGTHYSEGLEELGTLASIKLQLLADFTLARPKIDVSTLKVYVDGAESLFGYSEGTNEVHLTNPGRARSTIDLNYCLKPEDTCTGAGCGGGPLGV